MKRDNYTFDSLVLITQKAVPDDATMLVIAGPTADFFPPEIDMLNAYTAKGGKVMVLLDPPASAGATPQPLLTKFLNDWGINAGNDVVLDASGMGRLLGTDASVPVVAQYPNHPITESLTGAMSAYPMARSMAPVDGGTNGHVAQPVLTTTPQSWAESDLSSLSSKSGQIEFNADKGDRQGPITLAAAVSAPATVTPPKPENASPDAPDTPSTPQTRVVAVGDSDFASNYAIGVPGNSDFFMNALNWLAQQENLIAVRPRQPQDHRLTLTADQQNRIMILSLFIIPGLVFATGVYTWWRRR
jgi:ABC-type uncharacterized transport system involved in gliding motility auxiliary subunit